MIRRFNRYELKYVLPAHKCEEIIADLDGFATADTHDAGSGYPITSLYYDSPTFDCFWAKVDGIKFRRKVRLRIYQAADIEKTERGMVEIKQRINRTVQKRRLELPLAHAEQLCAGTLEPSWDEQNLDEMDQQVASEVRYLVHALSLRPTCITAYQRRAFVGNRYDSGLRITFDSSLAGRVHDLRVNSPAKNHPIAPPDWCIMEVKADDAIPDWVTSLLARHSCSLQRVSKYCAALARLANLKVSTVSLPNPYGPTVQRARENR